jgi:polysaccharide pyruvyl transferase WcaK-like protein
MAKRILLIDPALHDRSGSPSPNLGDQIISRAVQREIHDLFGSDLELARAPSHAFPGWDIAQQVRGSDCTIVGGSNLLSFHPVRPTSWKIGLSGLMGFKNLVLMGAGWGSYQTRGNRYGRWVARRILSDSGLHSLRDQYSTDRARMSLGLRGSINTACPTMWRLSSQHLASIRRRSGAVCLFSLTDYAKDVRQDTALLEVLSKHYGGNLLLWPQGARDLDYVRSLGYQGKAIERSLNSLIGTLRSTDGLDYVGTRLHAGILCLEYGVRSMIVSVDNRATEIQRDTGLSVTERSDLAGLSRWLAEDVETRLTLPYENIDRWKKSVLRMAERGCHG